MDGWRWKTGSGRKKNGIDATRQHTRNHQLIILPHPHKPPQQCSRYQPADESAQHSLAQRGDVSPPTLPRQLRRQEAAQAPLVPASKKYHLTWLPNYEDTWRPPKSKHHPKEKGRAAVARTEAGADGPRAPLWRHAAPSRRRRAPSRIWL